jgi:hypothetical protein
MRAAVASTPEGLANRAISRQRPTDMSALEVRAPDLPMRQAPTVHRNSQERFSFTRNRRMPKRIAFWLAYGVVVAATSISGCLLVRGMRYPSTEVSAYLVAALEKLNTIATPFLNVGNASPPTQHEPGWVEPDLAIALNPVTNTQAALADVPGVEPALADAAPAALAPGEEVRQEYAEGIAITREGSSSEKSGAKTTAAPPAGTLEERLGATSGASATEPSSLSVQNQSLAKELSEESASSRSRSAALAIASETEKTSSTQAAIIVPTMKRDDQRLSALETETLLSRGNALLSTGDFASARLFYEFAVEPGSSTAALRLGATFDPAFIRQAPLIRVTGDLEKALYWYRRARDLGSSEADALLRSRETAAE